MKSTKYFFIIFCVLVSNISMLAHVRWAVEGNLGSGVLLGLLGLPGNGSTSFCYRVGPTVIIPVKGWFSIRPGLMWSHKGGTLDGFYGNEQIVSAKIPISLDFLEVPLMCALRIPIKQKFALTLKFGPYAGVGLYGKTKVKTEEGVSMSMPMNLFSEECDYFGNVQSSNKKKFALPKLNRWDVGTTWGVEFEFCKHYAIGANLSWGCTRLSPEFLNDNVVEGLMQVIFAMDRIKPFTSMFSFCYSF